MKEREKIKIFFIEDVPEDLIIAEETLKRENIPFISKNTYIFEELESNIKSFRPDVIISDYILPGFTALDVLSLCKEIAPYIPFIVLTGSVNEEVAVECIKKGADDYILKKHIKKLPFAIKDAIEKKKLEEDAKKEKDILNTIVNYSPVGIVLLDKEEKIIHANEAFLKLFNIKREELKQRVCQGFIFKIFDKAGKEVPKEKCPITRVYNEKKIIELDEYRVKIEDRQEVIVTINAVPVFDKNGTLSSAIVIFNDVTEYKKIFNQLLQSQKLESIGRLLSSIIHDSNNMLSVILGFADLSLKLIPKENKVYKYIENIYQAGSQLKQLLTQLLSFCKKDIQKLEVVNLNDLINEIKNMLEKLVGENIEIVYNLFPNLDNIKADKSQINQIIFNLITNAKEAMPEGGKIYISTEKLYFKEKYYELEAGSYVLLSVRDTGIGISDEVKEHIFEPFFTTKEKGTGLGLATIYGIVKQHKGHITVYSEKGLGTTFKVYLPSLQNLEQNEIKEKETLTDIETPSKEGKTILVVEDNSEVRKFLVDLLTEYGYKVQDFSNPLTALETIRKELSHFDLLISDIVMPNMSGIAFYEKLKEMTPQIKTLFISGYPEVSEQEKEKLKKENFISKPFIHQEILKKIREVLYKA